MAASGAGAAISLPKGGGALKGIGEKFSPDLHTGTGTLTVPLAIPNGRHGFQPDLRLSYSTAHGNGPFGLGWTVDVAGVVRQTSHGIPRYDDGHDVFIVSGAEDLVPIESTATATRYRPRTEGWFARILHHRDTANSYWEVTEKSGRISRYGTRASLGSDPAAIADPERRTHVFAWRLTRTEDVFGNRIEYEYERDTGRDGPHVWDQLYLSRIRYADHGDRADPSFLLTIDFTYELRPDPFSDHRSGFEIRTRKRCTSVALRSHAAGDRLIRTYGLVYADAHPDLAAAVPVNRASLLSRVTVTGHDGAATEQLPPLDFQYTPFSPERRTLVPVTSTDLPPQSLADRDVTLVDLFARGLPDLLQMNGTVRYWRNLGEGRFDLPRFMAQAPAGVSLTDPGVQLVDADGNGRADLLVTSGATSGYFPLDGHGGWDARSFQRFRQAPSFSLADPDVRLLDLDGDGVTDAVRSGARFECFFNDPARGWDRTRTVERQSADRFPDVTFSDPRVRIADLSGDGLQDIVLLNDGHVVYWPHRGFGSWGEPVHMAGSPRFPYGYDPRRVLLGDVDGDGLADLVYVDDTTVTLWINQAGNGWSEPITIHGTPPVLDPDAIALVDLLGSGIAGVLWTRRADGVSRERMFFLDFTGSVKPYLLAAVDNHMGGVTTITYAPSTRFYLEDQRTRDRRWRTELPMPVHVVSRREVVDHFSGGRLISDYRYHHGHWDGAEREFRGFGMVEQFDTERFGDRSAPFYSPPTVTRTWFHQGPVGDERGDWQELDWSSEYFGEDPPLLPHTEQVNRYLRTLPAGPDARRIRRDALRALRGSVLRTELYALDGSALESRPYVVTESSYMLAEIERPADPASDRRRVFFPHPVASRTTQWERGRDPMTTFTFTRYRRADTDPLDPFGRPIGLCAIACPRGWRTMADRPAEPYVATYQLTEYAAPTDPTVYIHQRVASTTVFELEDTIGKTVFDLAARTEISAAMALTSHSRQFYDGAAFLGLPRGQVGRHGALARSETLAFTDDVLQKAYGSAVPPYIRPAGAPAWTADYPAEFRTLLPVRAGYVFHPGSASPTDPAGYYVTTDRYRCDTHTDPNGRGLVFESLDPLHDAAVPAAHRTLTTYDPFQLLPVSVTDAAGLTMTTAYDSRLLAPAAVTDANGNTTRFSYSPLGFITSTWVGSKAATEGDRARPSVRFEYGLRAFEESAPAARQPTYVRTIRQVHHDTAATVPLPERDETIETIEYSDGFGRLLQSRTRSDDDRFGDATFGGGDAVLPPTPGDPGGDVVGVTNPNAANPNVVVSGWVRRDNKGRTVERYEPFQSHGWTYAQAGEAQRGQQERIFHDPLGRVVRAVAADGSEQRSIYGVPGRIAAPDLERPDVFEPTPWECYAYDANDNAGRTHPAQAASYRHHWNTPASNRYDALGRIVETVARNRDVPPTPVAPLPPIEEVRTRVTYDSRGNVLTVVDARGHTVVANTFDHLNRIVRVDSTDAGRQLVVPDATGAIVETRSANGGLALSGFDGLNRSIRIWARDTTGEAITLRERREYGDGGTPSQPTADRAAARAANRLGRPTRLLDEAGLLVTDTYDFKGNLLSQARQVVSEAAILSVFNGPPPGWNVTPFRVDWSSPGSTPLDARVYATGAEYDALNRIRRLTYPQDVGGARRQSVPRYGRCGGLAGVTLDGDTFVERIAYNAKNQRVLIVYGNGLMTRYAYDARTFRVARIRTEGFTTPAPLTYRRTGAVLQDVGYEYDLAGNVIAIHDRTPECGVPGTVEGRDALDRRFVYDAAYQLRSATGRECDEPPRVPWDDTPRGTDLTRVRAWTERYRQDAVGNLTRITHESNATTFVSDLDVQTATNRLNTLTRGLDVFAYTYDANGNLTSEATSRHLEWDHRDQLRVYRTQTAGSEPTIHAHYLYDASGLRVMKVVRKPGNRSEVTVSIDGIFEHERITTAGSVRENTTLHVMDDRARIAMRRVGPAFADDPTPAVKYHLADHLANSTVVVDGSGALVNREEYTPYGLTSFGGFGRKRYRFGGHERDAESDLYYAGARYYLPWIGRWASCDPAGTADGPNLYAYVHNNPLSMRDPTGTTGENDCGLTLCDGGTTPPNTTSTERPADYYAETPVEDSTPIGPPPPPPAPPVPPGRSPKAPHLTKEQWDEAFKNMGGPKKEKTDADRVAETVQEVVLGVMSATNPVSQATQALDELTDGGVRQLKRDIQKAVGFSDTDMVALDLILMTEGGMMLESANHARMGASARMGAPRISNPYDYLPARSKVLQHQIGQDLSLHPIAERQTPVSVSQPNVPSRVHILNVGTKQAYESLTSGRIRLEPWEMPGEPPTFVRIDGRLRLDPHVEEAGATTPGYGRFGGFTGSTPRGCPSCSVRFHNGVYDGWLHVNPTPNIDYVNTPLEIFYPNR